MLRNTISLLLLCGASLSFGQIQLLNDEFNDVRSIINWKNINIEEQWGIEQLEHYSINDTTAGKMVMIPRTASWFEGYRGPLLYKEASGNFTITTKVDILGRDNPDLPELDYNLAGIMIRHVREYPNGALGMNGWASTDNNYIFLAAGAAALDHPTCVGCPAPHFEVKNTTDGISNLRVASIDTASTLIRITRIDDVFIVMYRLESDHVWVVHERFQRNDFPDTLQVGLVVYTDWTKVSSLPTVTHNSTQIEGAECSGTPCDPDIIGEFEYFRFDSVSVPNGIGSNFMDENDVTNAELLEFLSFSSVEYCPDQLHITEPIDSNSYQRFQAMSFISFADTVAENSIITISASDSITFSNGFITQNGVIVEVDTTGCN